MSECFYCKKALGFNEERYLIRTKDVRFRGRKRYQTAGYCCLDCEDNGERTQYTSEEWRELRDKEKQP